MKKRFFLLPILLILSLSSVGWGVVYPPGVTKIDKIESGEPNFWITGAGSGVTLLDVPGGIVLTGKNPRLRGFTLRGVRNEGIGLTLKNTYRALLDDIEIYGYELQLLSLCTITGRQWLHSYRDVYIYGALDGTGKIYEERIRGVELRYEGDKEVGWPKGFFSNTHTLWGGRIAVPGIPLLIDGPSETSMFGTYIDMLLKPVTMTNRSPGLQMHGVHLDRGKRARQLNIPCVVLGDPKFNLFKFFGQHVSLKTPGLIVDSTGKTVDPKFYYLSPEGYWE